MKKNKNLAGKQVAVFICRFEVNDKDNVEFVINEAIYSDIPSDLVTNLMLNVNLISQTLNPYRHFSNGNILMDINFITFEETEILLNDRMHYSLSKEELDIIFMNAKKIVETIVTVINNRGI